MMADTRSAKPVLFTQRFHSCTADGETEEWRPAGAKPCTHIVLEEGTREVVLGLEVLKSTQF